MKKMSSKSSVLKRFVRQLDLQLFAWMGIIYLIIFCFIPMLGIVIAFKDYSINSGFGGILTSDWVGLKYFREFVTDYRFGELVRNTLAISTLKMIFAFPVPILLAVMISEVHNQPFKRVVQTISYLPNFISWVLVYGICCLLYTSRCV